MSTKIYNAYKFIGKLSDLIKILKDIRKEYQNDKIETLSKFKKCEFKKETFKFLSKDYSMLELVDEPLGDLILSDILEMEMKIGYNTPLNISSSAVIYSNNNDIYVQFFGLNEKYIKKLNEYLIDFHYQNQTDMSNYDYNEEKWCEMSDDRKKELQDDWDNRKMVWDKIINNSDTFSESGLVFEFNPTDYKLNYFCGIILNNIKTSLN